jgi:hypothetical protein
MFALISGIQCLRLDRSDHITPCEALQRNSKSRITRYLFLLLALIASAAQAFTVSGRNYRTNGASSDVQAALNAAPTGSTVLIPSGSYIWSSAVKMSTAVHLEGTGSSSTTIVCAVANTGCLDVTFSSHGNSEISGIAFTLGSITVNYHGMVEVFGNSTGQPANPNGVLLLHDCEFTVNQNGQDCVLWKTNGGVIWNCTFQSNDIDCAGVYCKNALGNTEVGDPWRSPSTIGTVDRTGRANTYIENCTFTDMFLQSINLDDNSRTVVRHNTFNNSAIGSHGQETSPWGVRHYEIYNNTFKFTTSGNTPFGKTYPLNLNYWFEDRGGTGCIFNNTVPDIRSKTWGAKATWLLVDFNIQRHSNNISCQTSYPSARQVGQTWIGSGGYSYPGAPVDGPGYGIDPLYVWGNTGGVNAQAPAIEDYPDQCGNRELVQHFIALNRDYFRSAKVNYTPYVYPHPLRSTVK